MRRITFQVVQDLRSLFDQAGSNCTIAIDIPIGLPTTEPRVCDTEARQLLGWPRRNSVFSPPARDVLSASTFGEALRINRGPLNTGISKQTWCIVPKIHDVDVLMKPEMQSYIREASPPSLGWTPSAASTTWAHVTIPPCGVTSTPVPTISSVSGFRIRTVKFRTS